MNIKHVFLTIFLAAMILTLKAVVAETNVPDNLWEQHMGEVSLALVLVESTKDDHQYNAIKVFIKNISAGTRYLPNKGNNFAIQLFYVDGSGKSVPLRDYTIKIPLIVTMPPLPILRPYKSQEVETKTVDLTPNELILVKAYPFFCRFYVSDQEAGGAKLVESTPKLLTEVINK